MLISVSSVKAIQPFLNGLALHFFCGRDIYLFIFIHIYNLEHLNPSPEVMRDKPLYFIKFHLFEAQKINYFGISQLC